MNQVLQLVIAALGVMAAWGSLLYFIYRGVEKRSSNRIDQVDNKIDAITNRLNDIENKVSYLTGISKGEQIAQNRQVVSALMKDTSK